MTGADKAWLSGRKNPAPRLKVSGRYEAQGPKAKPESKVDRLHAIDDGTKTDEELAALIGSHPAYVRVVRIAAMRRKAYAKRMDPT